MLVSLEQEVNVNLIHQTERELLDYTIYSQNDVAAFIEAWNKPGKQDEYSIRTYTRNKGLSFP